MKRRISRLLAWKLRKGCGSGYIFYEEYAFLSTEISTPSLQQPVERTGSCNLALLEAKNKTLCAVAKQQVRKPRL